MTEEHRDFPPAATTSPATPSSPGASPPQAAISSEVLKTAFKAFKKRWKLTRLDYDSRIGRGPLSAGQKSSIGGITPPNQFPRAVWDALVEQGRLKYLGSGCYSLPE